MTSAVKISIMFVTEVEGFAGSSVRATIGSFVPREKPQPAEGIRLPIEVTPIGIDPVVDLLRTRCFGFCRCGTQQPVPLLWTADSVEPKEAA